MRRWRVLSAFLGCAGLLACSQNGEIKPAENSPAAASAPPAAVSAPVQTGTGSGQAAFEFPVIPEIEVPDFLGTSPAQARLEAAMPQLQDPIAGLRIRTASCAPDGSLQTRGGALMRTDENGVWRYNGEAGVFRIGADGSGSANFDGGVVRVNADGSGSINGADGVIIRVNADGSGSYNGPLGIIRLDGKGGGSWNSPKHGIIRNNGDGSGTWNGPQGIVTVNADGSGKWNSNTGLLATNHGNGSGRVGTPGEETAMAPLPPLPPAGRFPPLQTLSVPAAPCGLVIALGDEVLFDFDRDEIRADAAVILNDLAAALQQLPQVQRLEVGGHTDAKGSDAYNLDLSQRRAAAVSQALQARGLNYPLTSQGYGESRPVAPNEIQGQDYPAGRQQNRRVEIFVRL